MYLGVNTYVEKLYDEQRMKAKFKILLTFGREKRGMIKKEHKGSF